MRLRFVEQIVDFTEQFVRLIGLAYEAAVVGNFSLSRLHFTGRDDQEDVGPTCVNLSREVHSVDCAGHLNVREKQPHIVAGL